MRILIIFIFMFNYSHVVNASSIKNIIISKDLKKYEDLTFFDSRNNQLNLIEYKGKLVLLNFWATWCAPCKEEMPSLDLLQKNEKLDNLIIFPINVGQDDIEKAKSFFVDLEIKNLNPYFDSPVTLAKIFKLRGIPTSIIFNKNGEEFARIVGSINFEDPEFINWLSNYN